jgi:hypothetical protein
VRSPFKVPFSGGGDDEEVLLRLRAFSGLEMKNSCNLTGGILRRRVCHLEEPVWMEGGGGGGGGGGHSLKLGSAVFSGARQTSPL